MSNPFHHSRIQLVYHLLIGLMCFISFSIHAQNVGIGVSSPEYKLTLGGTENVLGVENGAVFFAKNNNDIYEPFLYPRYIDNRTLMNYGTGGFQIRDMTYTTRFQITNSGNVGINTEFPTASLHVVGQVRIQDGLQADGKVLMSDAGGLASWQFPPAGTETDPQVASSVSNCVPKWNGTALSDGLIYDNGTNVGIGTLAPTAKLHVNGSLRITNGSQGAGKVLTSDSSGVASWQTSPPLVETDPQVNCIFTNHLSRWNGSALVDGMIFDDFNRVGVGIDAPTERFEVKTLGSYGNTGCISLIAPHMQVGATTGLKFGKEDTYANQAELRFNYQGISGPYNRCEFGFLGMQPFFFLNMQGRVGIGIQDPVGQFQLSLDQGFKPATSTWTILSDARVKNIEGHYAKGLKEILQLNPILYHYKNTRNKTFSPEVLAAENVGLTAQEVQQVFPEAVGEDEDGTLNLNMHSILIAQINAIKELNAMIVSQQQQIDELKAKLEEK